MSSAQTALYSLASSWTSGSQWNTCPISAYVAGSSGSTTPPPAPTNTTLPSIAGTTTQGQAVSTSNGTWSGSPTAYGYQWQDCSSTGASCTNISGAASSSYTLTVNDVGHTLRAIVTATNAGGSVSATSIQSAVVLAPASPPPPAAPANTAPPVISGAPTEGQILQTSTGAWSGSPTGYSYQWKDCNSTGGSCANISGATSSAYTLAASDVGATMMVTVTASNAGGSASGDSSATAAVTALSTGGGGTQPTGVTLQQIDGGQGYYGQWSNSLPASTSFYPLAVFDQTLGYDGANWDPSQLAAYKADGINTFVNLYNGYNSAMMTALKADGMHDIDSPLANGYEGSTLGGYVWFDEADGNNDCGSVPSAAVLGTTVSCAPTSDGRTPSSVISEVTADLHHVDPTRAVYGNYSKPVALNSGLTPAQASAYVNGVDIASYDYYVINDGWQTDHSLWLQYDAVRNTRQESGYDRPIWVFIEAGEVFPSNQWSGVTPTPAMSVAEAWNAIIGGARGIEWFDHDFGGSSGGYASSSDDLIDSNPVFGSLQAAVTAFNQRATLLAPILNDPFANSYVTNNGQMNVMAKYDQTSNNYYVFAAPRSNSSQNITFTTAGGYSGPVQVQGENRTVAATNGVFTDNFANQTAVHIYIIPHS
ncbi:MAG TPA: hypothetical protein VG294_03120 [Solirubrobacteraceae bacterium]|nr:hypothetical protein [Solirubrobacteraceae bacterium]